MQKVTNLNQNQKKNNIPSSGESNSNGYKLKKDVTLFVVRRSLLESGMEAFEMVNRSLFEKYRCDISECFERPEYLADVLRYVYDGSYTVVVDSIKKSLDKFAQEDEIREFLKKIS